MNKLSISRKLERILTLYIKHVMQDEDLNVHEGRDVALVVELPRLICMATDATNHPSMPSEVGIRIVNMRFEFAVDSVDETDQVVGRVELDEWRDKLENAVSDLASIRDFIQTVDFEWEGCQLHIYDINKESEPSDFERTDWIESFEIAVTCQLVFIA
jgi:hypothetical protein